MIAEFCNGRYCPENGYFCRFMDQSGTCIATNCRRITELMIEREIDIRAEQEKELKNALVEAKENCNENSHDFMV